MPTYDYKCSKCEHTFERFHGINEKPEIKCPLCGEKAEKMIGPGIGLIFKGSGFYITDYKKKDNGSNGKKYKPTENKGKTEKQEGKKAETTGENTSTTENKAKVEKEK